MLAKIQRSKMKVFHASLASLLVCSTNIAMADTLKHDAMKPLLADTTQDLKKRGVHVTPHQAAPQVQHAPVSKAIQPTYHPPVSNKAIQPTYHPPVSNKAIQPTYHPPVSNKAIQPTYHPPVSNKVIQPTYHPPVSNKVIQPTYHPPVSNKVIQPTYHAPVSNNVIQPTHHAPLSHKATSPVTNNQTNISNAPTTPSKNITTHGVQPVSHVGPNAGAVNTNVHLNTVKTAGSSHQITKTNIQKSRLLNQHFINSPQNAKWTKNISNSQHVFRQHSHAGIVQHAHVFNSFYHNPHYHNWYNKWHGWGFYGGFWYPFYPSYDIEIYFFYPAVYWFFVGDPVPVEYYSDYYPSGPAPSGDCLTSFPYKNIYYPTITLRDLLVEMSGLPTNVLCSFRAAVINFTSQLQQDVSTNFGTNYSFSQNGIVITYYQNLQNQAVALAGYVSDDQIHMAFEGLLDLNNPDQSIAFAPRGQEPSADEIQALTNLNNRIQALGGSAFDTQPATGDQTQAPAGLPASNTAPGP